MTDHTEEMIDQQIDWCLDRIAEKKLMLDLAIKAKIKFSPFKKGQKVRFVEWYNAKDVNPKEQNGIIDSVYYDKKKGFSYYISPATINWEIKKGRNDVSIDSKGSRAGIIKPFKP